MFKYKTILISPKMLLMLVMGFSSGLPIALAISTLQAWVASEGLSLKAVGAFTLVQLPYQLKFIWAPVIDRFTPPFLGRRRGWMLITQVAVVLAIVAVGSCNPISNIGFLAAMAVLLSFTSASQDVVIDAYRTEALTTDERGSGAALAILGYRIGMLVSGSLALIMADQLAWSTVYYIMATLMSFGVIATIFAPEPSNENPPKTLKAAVIEPFKEFLGRPIFLQILAFILLYKLADVMALALSTKFMLELGFSKTEIGVVYKGLGLLATILGAILGASLMAKLKLQQALFYFGIAQALAIVSFAVLAYIGKNFELLSLSVFLENLTSGMGTAAFSAFLISQCNSKYAATQYALFSAISSLPRAAAGPPAAFFVGVFGWTGLFLFAILCALPGLYLAKKMKFES